MKVGASWLPSLPRISLEDPGVGGGSGRGMGEVAMTGLVSFADHVDECECGSGGRGRRRAKYRCSA